MSARRGAPTHSTRHDRRAASSRARAQIAGMLADGTTDQARAIIGSANVLTAALCMATGNSPSEVCGQAAVKNLQDSLAVLPTPRPRS